ncbi:MAG TPA: two-component regulator propeller domain-containing protein, partial [Puia sp.]
MNPTQPRLLLLLTVFFSFMTCRVGAQCLDQRSYVRYTRLEGLSNNYIAGIVEDSAGYIWIATHKGLNRFDGKSFTSVYRGSPHSPIPDNFIVSMRSQSPEEIIGTTRAGGFSFNPACGGYKQFVVPCDSSIFFWTNHMLDIVRDKKDNYVISTKTGLYVFNKEGQLVRRYDHHVPSDVGSQELIFGGWVSKMDNGMVLQQNGLLGSAYDPASNTIDTLYIAKQKFIRDQITDAVGNMRPAWYGRSGEMIILDREKNSIDVVDTKSMQVTSNMMPFVVKTDLGWTSRVTYLSDTSLIITCRNSGFYLLHLNPHTRTISCNGEKYFQGSVCTTIYQDRETRLWVGTADGLYKENIQNSFFSVTNLSNQYPYLQDHEIRSIYADDSLLYAGLQNGGGVLVMNKHTGNIRSKVEFGPQFDYSNTITNIFPYSKDTLWIGTNTGIVWLNKRNRHFGKLAVPPPLSWIQEINSTCFFEDSRSDVWISFGRLNSLVRYNRATRSFTDMSPPTNPWLRVTYVFSMAEDLQGNVWLAGDGICRWNVKKQMVDTLIPYPNVSRLLRNYMYILDRDNKNNLWLSSFDNEIIQFDCTTARMYLRQEENHLIDGNTITSSPIINNYIWMGTDNGISAFNIHNYSVQQFTYAD